MGKSSVKKVALVAFEGISAFHLSVPCLVFQDAFIDRQPMFELSLCSLHQREISTGSGFGIVVDEGLDILDAADIVIVPSWPNSLPPVPAELRERLVHAHARGAMLVGLCLGAFVIAETGLLDGKTATTHWAFSEAFRTRFPKVEFDSQPLFIEHDQLITSAGTAASLDCCLQIIRRLCGSELANQLARVMVTAPFRSGGQQQYIPSPIAARPEKVTSLTQVIDQVEKAINQAHSIDSLAAQCAMSRRTFTRQFKAAYGCTFNHWLLDQRLKLSQQLLESSNYSISQVAELSGFGSESVYRKHFKTAFQITPMQWRTTFSGTAPVTP
ncbi:AraC family transcriptional regulator [Photobacterium jeanii]|uniref:AraC family transcriptional regulator n=1 Tax=Photobacterium jeanii TaxID=858640 RepID=A0A178K907_9GAMM|nr:helix-turn-helix domain-containing protein [Photobacterium jeanii]OAN13172.1 AraC family transcriptional regulator [Photobacterium jeanii]PST89324.1 AraC family transcriptional regulator [Photobacterium jeanii]